MAGTKLAPATREGNRLEMLRRLALKLARQLDAGVEDKSLASIARQYRETIREIEEIEGAVKTDDEIDELLSARAADGKPGAVRKNRTAVS